MKHAALVVAMSVAVSMDAVAQNPVISSVLNQATWSMPVSPGMPVSVNGTNLAGSNNDCPGPKVPLTCGSVSVTVNGRAMPVRYTFPGQVVTYIPSDVQPGQASIVVKNAQGLSTAPFPVTVEAFAPGIQRLTDNGMTTGYFSDSSQRYITGMNPAIPGRELTLYAVGLGPTNPAVPAGEMGSAPVVTMPTLYVANRPVDVTSAGLGCAAMCDPGIYLVRFILPPDTPQGSLLVRLEAGGKRSNSEALIVGPQVSAPAVGYLQSFFDARVRAMSPGAAANVVGGGFASISGGPGAPCVTDIGVWPTKCQGVTVTVNGRTAAIQAVTPSQITIQIPFELTPGPATLVVERAIDNHVLRSAPFSFTLDAYSPTIPANLISPYAGVMVASTGAVSKTNPLLPGDDVYVFAIGLGQTNPPLVTGFAMTQPVRTVTAPSVTIGGKPLTNVVAEVLPGMIGQYRITAKVPAGMGVGDLPIVVEIGGKKSQDGLLVPVANAPVIAAVANGASGLANDIVSGSWVSIWGRNLSATRREWREDDIVYDWLPVSLDGVEVTIGNIAAVVAFVSPLQLNVLAPDNLPIGPVEVTVKSALGWQKSTANVKPYSPGLFQLQIPPGLFVMALHSDWAYVGRPEMLAPGSNVRPAQPGETVVFYGTGFGKTNPDVSSRQRFNGAAPLAGTTPVRLQIGPAQAQVVYVGLAGNGLYQINAVMPEVPDGDHEVIVSMGGESGPRGRYIAIKR